MNATSRISKITSPLCKKRDFHGSGESFFKVDHFVKGTDDLTSTLKKNQNI